MTKKTWIVALAVAGIGVTFAVAHKASTSGGWPANADSTQLKFNHAYHVGEAGIACADCHTAAAKSDKAADNLRPNHDNCSTCHEEQVNNTCSFCHKDTTNIQATPAPARDLLFSHQRHVGMKDVECTTCHAGLDKVEYAGPANMPSMATCVTCHNNAKATRECAACHTSFAALIPADHLEPNFRIGHRQAARLGGLDVECSTCHQQSFCAQCHAGAPLISLGGASPMADPSPKATEGKDSPKQMTLQMVHPMNYRLFHGMDAKAKTMDCQTCHSTEQFCVACHQTEDRLAPGQVPVSHIGSGFTTLGAGSGGGRHAQLARRDIESCVSCHDVRGGDPVCVTCHVDPDGVKGTDPRTHPSGFRQGGGNGEWHTDPGATCYACHTDMNAHPGGTAGKGFCGYCHGPK
jgi:hypothetical protein